jgi:hypothetical protein
MEHVMQTHAIMRLAKDAPPLDSCYQFAAGGERFVGVVANVVPVGDADVRITLSMTTAEHERLLAAER